MVKWFHRSTRAVKRSKLNLNLIRRGAPPLHYRPWLTTSKSKRGAKKIKSAYTSWLK